MGEWAETIKPITDKLEIPAVFGLSVQFNPAGADALYRLLKQIAGIIDNEIIKREREARIATVMSFRLFGFRFTVKRDVR